ncbi:FAD:protein FMN transferase [Alkaliflexus imshenetskii]|jgi:FAD:protein FMN transferase|uniref:FAD:protein FMN transferase n=1 Tax=Alkaliflexus imshenetskii TaxID=286730 RepID=UPI00047ED489|nr:FAD:protein FMN transferase [Alkaliflexus imshenetskii]
MNIKNLALFWLLLLLFGCGSKENSYQVNEGWIFGTTYRIVYDSKEDHHESIRALLDSFNRSLSTFDSTSVISRVNRGEEGVVADPFFKHLFKNAEKITRETNGAFDMTVAPLVNAWGFGFKKMDSVNQQIVDSLLQFVGMDFVTIQDGVIVKNKPGVMLDGSAIAKGYGVDVVASHLKSYGIRNLMVEIGGEVSTLGVNPKGQLWRIGIDRPIDDPSASNRELQMIIGLSGQALATSGNYRNFYVKDGIKYAHTIDPRTGFPVNHSLLSASVIAADCMSADAYATACMVLGIDESLALIESLPGVEACFIYHTESGEQVVYTTGFDQYIHQKN